MRFKTKVRVGAVLLSMILAFTMSMGSIGYAAENQITLTPSRDGQYVSQIIDALGGGDGLYKAGLNGMDMYDHLGYVYMGWRTTGGIWQNQVINQYIMKKLADSGFQTTDEEVATPYGTISPSDKSNDYSGDFAWITQYQGTDEKNLGNVWDPEYSSMNVYLADVSGKDVQDNEATELAKVISGEQWGFDPCTEIYQKKFAQTFGMDYESEIASLPDDNAKVEAMHKKLMSSDVPKDERTSVDDFTYVKRKSIAEPNLEAVLNQRARLARDSCFTAPTGTDPATAEPLSGEFIYVGAVNELNNTNSEGIPAEEIAGKVLLTDSEISISFKYARNNGAIGVASKSAVDGYLCPRDKEGNITYPWYTTSRFGGGIDLDDTIKATEAGTPIVEWQFSNQQYDSLRKLLNKAKAINEAATNETDKVKVVCDQIAIGQTYPMTKTLGKPGVGQAVAIAEVKGSVHPDKRVLICAHVQEPGSNDNATGVASLLGMATAYKQLVDQGKIPRPKCTLTFLWGDENNLATYWMAGHPEQTKNIIGSLDMDMTGEDPEKTGGSMRIEKTPDPSADYGYTLDAVPWDEPDKNIPSLSNPYFDENYKSSQNGNFVRLPDSHTLWGAGDTDGLFKAGWYLNDLYMYVTSTVIHRHDPNFKVDVCPYEGGSDHSDFLEKGIPALLTWHFTDYTYHTTNDTIYMSSPREMESVSITTLATGLVMSDLCHDSAAAMEILSAVKEAALKRMDAEKINTDHHLIYTKAGNTTYEKALANEQEVLSAWGNWYDAALASVATLVDEPSAELKNSIASARAEMANRTDASLRYASDVLVDEAAKSRAAREAAHKRTVAGVKVKNKNRKAIVTWRATSGATGYQIVYKNGKGSFKTLKETTGIKVKSKKLKMGKKYTFKVRPYTTINGEKVYGKFSKSKTVKIKK